MHKFFVKLENEVHMNMTNMHMHPNFADGALPLQVGVGLTRMAVTPRQLRLFCSGTLCGRGYGGWFSPSTGQRSGRYVHPVAAGPSELLLYRHA